MATTLNSGSPNPMIALWIVAPCSIKLRKPSARAVQIVPIRERDPVLAR
jgi:hypothetical protein